MGFQNHARSLQQKHDLGWQKTVKNTGVFSAPFPKSIQYDITRSLGALRAPTSSWRPFGPIDFVLGALRALRVAKTCRLCRPVGAKFFLAGANFWAIHAKKLCHYVHSLTFWSLRVQDNVAGGRDEEDVQLSLTLSWVKLILQQNQTHQYAI